MSGDAMDHWMIKVEPEEQVDTVKKAVKIKAEPEDGDLITACIDIEEHPVKLEKSVQLICGLPAPDTETSDQEQSHDVGNLPCFHNIPTITYIIYGTVFCTKKIL
jgi:hypothetical protein